MPKKTQEPEPQDISVDDILGEEEENDNTTEGQEASRLKDFFSVKGEGFKDTQQFEEALQKNGLTMEKLVGTVRRLLLRGKPAIKIRALETLRRFAELVYGTEISLRQDSLAQETAEDLKDRRKALEERMLTLLVAKKKEEKTA